MGQFNEGDKTASLLLAFLLDESWISLFVVDEGFRVRFASRAAARILGCEPEKMVGRPGEEFMPADYAAERRALVKSVIESGQTAVFHETLGGWKCRTHVIPLPPEGDGLRRVAVLLQPLALLPDDGPTASAHLVMDVKVNDGDPLAHLTPRQKEVLRYIGEGYAPAEIARMITRAPKTVEFHRSALGKKLNVATRAEIGLIAIRAGLVRVFKLRPSAPQRSRRSSKPSGTGANGRVRAAGR